MAKTTVEGLYNVAALAPAHLFRCGVSWCFKMSSPKETDSHTQLSHCSTHPYAPPLRLLLVLHLQTYRLGATRSYSVDLGDFNCSIYLGIQAHLYTRLINLGPIDNEAFSGADMP